MGDFENLDLAEKVLRLSENYGVGTESRKILRDAAEALKRPAEQDGGWVLVPREATEEMCNAAECAFGTEEMWKAFLSAAPAAGER